MHQGTQATAAVQHALDAVTFAGTTVVLSPLAVGREVPGPLVVRRAVRLDGMGATVYGPAAAGPALRVAADGVQLVNLCVEVTTPGGCAILVDPGHTVSFMDVNVRGPVVGLGDEDGSWQLPDVLSLGDLPAGHRAERLVRIIVPVACQLSSGVYGLSVDPPQLPAGRSEVRLVVDDDVPADTLLYGPILLRTALLTRRITVTGRVVRTAAPAPSAVAWEADEWDPPIPSPAALPAEPATRSLPTHPEPTPSAGRPAARSKRVSLPTERTLGGAFGLKPTAEITAAATPAVGGAFAPPPPPPPPPSNTDPPVAEPVVPPPRKVVRRSSLPSGNSFGGGDTKG